MEVQARAEPFLSLGDDGKGCIVVFQTQMRLQ